MAALDPLLDEFFAYWWSTHPTHATAAGVHAYDAELERHDAASLAERARRHREYLGAFERIDPADVGERIDVELVADRLHWELYELEEVRSHRRNPFHYLDAPLGALYLMAIRDYAPAETRAREAARRLGELRRVLDEAKENLTEASPVLVEAGEALARSGLSLIEYVLPVHLGTALEDDPAEFARWENALRGAESALLDFSRWLREELAPRATDTFAIGREAFEVRLRYEHGLFYSADELLNFGESLKRRTEAMLSGVAREIAGHGDWRAVVESLKDEHPPAEGLVDAYADAMAEARAFVEERDLVTIPAGESLEVTATPEFLRPLIPYAAYQAPAVHETEQKGLFFVTPPADGAAGEALRDHSVHGLPVTALHEAYPGHHLQLTRSNRAGSEPRRIFRTPVFAEGWALYCEEMMWEQGFYTDPRVRLLQLKDLLWRACRVVVDVGLHVHGWTRDRAVEYMVREAGLERPNVEVEVRRYCTDPTQPLSYAVGMREILRLRERYLARTGGRFRLREFHDRLLDWGTIPPSLAARGMGLV